MKANIQAVAFDAYNTLCYISNPQHPFAELLAHSQTAVSEAIRLFMTSDLELRELSERIAPEYTCDFADVERMVRIEVDSVRLFPDVEETLDQLRARGIKLGVISNLARPYAAPVQQLLGSRIDHYVWSFQVGAIKPEPAIFAKLCLQLGTHPSQVLMVGDSIRSDVAGAQSFGMPALHLTRTATKHTSQSIVGLTDVIDMFS